MATAALINGSDLIIKIAATSGGAHVEMAFATSCSLEISRDEIDQSNKNSGAWKAIIPGMRSWTLSSESLFYVGVPGAPAVGMETYHDLMSVYLADAGNNTPVFIEFTMRSATTGDKYYSGKAYITSLSLNGGLEDQSTYSVSLSGSEALAIATT
tara:strand:+ start:7313 stop:7777 length:465 start_codon:yes stop_codon:yes gene_type:complete